MQKEEGIKPASRANEKVLRSHPLERRKMPSWNVRQTFHLSKAIQKLYII